MHVTGIAYHACMVLTAGDLHFCCLHKQEVGQEICCQMQRKLYGKL